MRQDTRIAFEFRKDSDTFTWLSGAAKQVGVSTEDYLRDRLSEIAFKQTPSLKIPSTAVAQSIETAAVGMPPAVVRRFTAWCAQHGLRADCFSATFADHRAERRAARRKNAA